MKLCSFIARSEWSLEYKCPYCVILKLHIYTSQSFTRTPLNLLSGTTTDNMWSDESTERSNSIRRCVSVEQSLAAEDEEWEFARLVPLNGAAKAAFNRLSVKSNDKTLSHHLQFIHDSKREQSQTYRSFVFALGRLPEFAPLGWRIGKGRPKQKNRGVDLLLLANEDDGVAGVHARFAWYKGGGGFFIIADNIRGVGVTINGETLSREQRLIPYRNTISIGECFFTLKFSQRSPLQEE